MARSTHESSALRHKVPCQPLLAPERRPGSPDIGCRTSSFCRLPSSFALLVPKRQHRFIIIRPRPSKTNQNQVKIGTFFSACQTESPATNPGRRRTHLRFEAKTEEDKLKPTYTEGNGALFFSSCQKRKPSPGWPAHHSSRRASESGSKQVSRPPHRMQNFFLLPSAFFLVPLCAQTLPFYRSRSLVTSE